MIASDKDAVSEQKEKRSIIYYQKFQYTVYLSKPVRTLKEPAPL
jgi:hypothetical protein